MAFPDRLRLPMTFRPERLRADLEALAAVDWTAHFVRQNYEGNWSALPLRSPAGETHPIRMINPDPAATHFVDTALLDATPYFRSVIETFACPVRVARLMRLTPGSVIKEHSDPDLDAEAGVARIHVPITTNPDVEFKVNGAPVAMAPGETWYLRLSDPHTVANRGQTDRIHLVIDMEVDAWLKDVMRQAQAMVTA
ncbi:MAG: aspartyl/asparaginyl beta-hydroxylase domain-containing protein [Caulobacter sp.]|nr:aspartyl/asparaginyl beta-hydroxylase domain-containing protein [Caulobacter sp.]